MSEPILSIFVVTYNRAPLLKRTLGYLASSSLRNFPITVLNNASTDDTAAMAQEVGAGLLDFKVITHPANIGANANILRAFDYSRARYTWVLCDDDVIDLSSFDDVLHVLEEGRVDFLHVGAHEEKAWATLGGSCKTPRELLASGYPYFKFSSFTPCNIFKTSTFIKQYLIPGYNNIGNSYPHMPFAFGMYRQDVSVYVAQRQLVTASIGGQSYTPTEWYFWWMKTCELLQQPADVRRAFLDQWRNIGYSGDEGGLQGFAQAKHSLGVADYFEQFERNYFTTSDRKRVKDYLSELNGDFQPQVFISHNLSRVKRVLKSAVKPR